MALPASSTTSVCVTETQSSFLFVADREAYWWRVRSVRTRQENYIPASHAAKVYHGWVLPRPCRRFPRQQLRGDSLCLCGSSWLFEGVERQKAEELLSLPGNRVGSFMVRESSRERGEQGRRAPLWRMAV